MSVARTLGELVGGDTGRRFAGEWEDHVDQWWHRSSSSFASVALTQHLGWPLWKQLVALVIGWMFGGGILSCDTDQYAYWRAMDRWLPDEWLGHGGPLGHHRLTHSPWLAGAGIVSCLAVTPGIWWLWLLPLQWLWHDLGDVLIGKGGPNVPCGPPWFLWWHNWGLGLFKSGGAVCWLLTIVCWAGTAWLVGGEAF